MNLLAKTNPNYSRWRFHCARTLDEAYYPALSEDDLAKANEDQVISRLYTAHRPKDDKYTPILMVGQIWLLGAGRILLRAYSTKESSMDIKSIGYPQWYLYTTTLDCAMGMFLAGQIEDFGKGLYADNRNLPHGPMRFPAALSMFETSVLALMSKVDGYLNLATSTKPNIDIERQYTHDIWDIHCELAMIKDVLDQQERVLDDLLLGSGVIDPGGKRLYPPSEQACGKQWDRVFAARSLLTKYQQRITKIKADAERIDKAIQDMLNLKRTFASMKEAENSSKAAQNSLRLARSGVVLSAAVIGFTLVTVIFTPLSFLTGLFALPTDELRRLMSSTNETKDVYVSRYIGGIFGKHNSRFAETSTSNSYQLELRLRH
jgi:hypothetical protein